jgi:hypothetical protein
MRSFAHRRKDTSAVVRGKGDRPVTFDLTWRAKHGLEAWA